MSDLALLTSRFVDEPPQPGTPEWWTTISASKVAAIMGVSPWTSLFNLWHTIHGDIEPDGENPATERGHYLEPSVLAWFRDTHPELNVYRTCTFRHPEHPDWIATLDALAVDGTMTAAAVEAKTSASRDEWGEEGTAEIPPYYLVQTTFQMVVTGLRTVWVPVLFGTGFQFALYKVTWDDVASMAAVVTEEVEDFQRSLAEHRPPPIDGSTFTYTAIKKMHPEIDDVTVEVPDELAVKFLDWNGDAAVVAEKVQQYRSEIAALMGNAKKATWNGKTLFTRQAKGGGTPYLVVAKNLPTPL